MRDTKRLTLRREALAELSAEELATAGAGATLTLYQGCSVDDVVWRFSLHQHCTWTCIR